MGGCFLAVFRMGQPRSRVGWLAGSRLVVGGVVRGGLGGVLPRAGWL